MKKILINGRVKIQEHLDGSYSLLVDGKEVSFNIPQGCDLGKSSEKITRFDNYRNEEDNTFYLELFLKEKGYFSVYKIGSHIGKYEPQPDIKHPHHFKGAGNTENSDNRKFHQSHYR
ncbi:MAG: hypothetical protein MRY57_02490 [Candidatus Pacebacteria bacterium]|nr:hypothetical protein [Candidatus Paceibacterota bacterium]